MSVSSIELILLVCAVLSVHQGAAQQFQPVIQPITIVQGGTSESCPSTPTREAARDNVTDQVRSNLQTIVTMLPTLQPQCGPGYWRQIVYLNTRDTTQECPSDWSEFSSPQRSCGRSTGNTASCDSAVFSTRGLEYERVCGRATGYNHNSADGFARLTLETGETADDNYVDGLSVTYGQPRNHIWTFAAGHGTSRFSVPRCPCDNTNRNVAPLPPSFVGENYFCDSEDNGALWDGLDCTTSCCQYNSPPWFQVQINGTTTEDIELRICSDQHNGDEDIRIELIQLYIQ